MVVLVAAGAGYWFFMKPASGAEKAPEPGDVVKLDAIQINLADDHYLQGRHRAAGQQGRGGGARRQQGAGRRPSTLFSGQSMEDLARRAFRDKMKKNLEHRLDEAYEGEVIGVYFTDFVSQ